MRDGTFVAPMERSDDCRNYDRCKIGDVYVDDEAGGWLYEFTDAGCCKNCSRSNFPYEMNANCYECDCIPGYHRGADGVCIK